MTTDDELSVEAATWSVQTAKLGALGLATGPLLWLWADMTIDDTLGLVPAYVIMGARFGGLLTIFGMALIASSLIIRFTPFGRRQPYLTTTIAVMLASALAAVAITPAAIFITIAALLVMSFNAGGVRTGQPARPIPHPLLASIIFGVLFVIAVVYFG